MMTITQSDIVPLNSLDLDAHFQTDPFGPDEHAQQHNKEYARAREESIAALTSLRSRIVAPHDWLHASGRADTVNGYAMRLVHLTLFRVKMAKQMVNLLRRHMQTLDDTGDERLHECIFWIEDDFLSFLRVLQLTTDAAALLKRAAVADSIHGITLYSQEMTTLSEDRKDHKRRAELEEHLGREACEQTIPGFPDSPSAFEAKQRFKDFMVLFPRCDNMSRQDGTSEERDEKIRNTLLACKDVIKNQPIADLAVARNRFRYEELVKTLPPPEEEEEVEVEKSASSAAAACAAASNATKKCKKCSNCGACTAVVEKQQDNPQIDRKQEEKDLEAFLDHIQCCDRRTRFTTAARCVQLASREFDVWSRRYMALVKMLSKSMHSCALAEPIWISAFSSALVAQQMMCSTKDTFSHLRAAIENDIAL